MTEKSAFKINGFFALIILSLTALYSANIVLSFPNHQSVSTLILGLLLGGGVIVGLSGFTIIQPNQSKVLTFFGTYLGVIRQAGFWFTVPLTFKENVSLRVVNFNSDKLKVNDLEGNPIEIAAVVVYKVSDSAKAVFDVEDYYEFVHTQSETSIRHIASQYAYDSFDESSTGFTLRQNSDEIAEELTKDLQTRLKVAGVDVLEARIMHLAYSSEIASAMLQRQQARAVLSARKTIVEGAVGLVESAITELGKKEVVKLDEQTKAKMVNNLMVSLVSESSAQPVINTGKVD